MFNFLKNNKELDAYIFFNCDDRKSKDSMNIMYNSTVYKGRRDSRRELWKKVKEEVQKGTILIDEKDMQDVRKEILEGDPAKASDFMTYGNVIRVGLV